MASRNRRLPYLLAAFFLTGGLGGCVTGTTSSLRPGMVTDAKRSTIGKKIILRVDPREYREGHAIGEGAGKRLSLGQDMKKILQQDLAAAWALPDSVIDALPGQTPGEHLVTLTVDWVHVEWPEGIPIIGSRATVSAQVRGTVTVQRVASGEEVFRQQYVGEAADDFMDYRYIASFQQWQGVLDLAYQRFFKQIVEDNRLTDLLQSSPAKPQPQEEPRPVAPKIGPVVAVFDVVDRARNRNLDQVTRYLQTALTQSLGFRVIPPDQIRARLVEEKKGTYKECYDQSCQIELGRALAAEKMLVTELLQVGEECVITATLFDLKSETSERAANARTGCSDAGLLNSIDQIVKQLGADSR